MALKVDCHGHLTDAEAWSEEVASALAGGVGIDLGAPSMRPLVKLVRERVGPELGSSIALMRLFPPDTLRGGSARLVALIAGLPVPENCL